MTKQRTKRAWITVLVVLATVACTRQPQAIAQPSEAQQIEEYSQEKLDAHRGKVVVLNFWAIWCVYCRIEMPDLEALHQQYRDQGVVVLGVNVAEDSAEIVEFTESNNLTFSMLRDKALVGAKTFGVANSGSITLPQTFLLDQQGQIRYRRLGPVTQQLMSQQLEPLLR